MDNTLTHFLKMWINVEIWTTTLTQTIIINSHSELFILFRLLVQLQLHYITEDERYFWRKWRNAKYSDTYSVITVLAQQNVLNWKQPKRFSSQFYTWISHLLTSTSLESPPAHLWHRRTIWILHIFMSFLTV